ncbi:MAG: DNA repair protein RadA [Chloroflexi bacterium RBG_16_72_14]|nr:MAG: DNA repair protein RadA [Chloroflexi bacterium RBG_16_72_14]
MARAQSRYVCQSCGASVLRWEGQCRSCGEWNTLVETVIREEPRRPSAAALAGAAAVPVALSHPDTAAEARRPVGIGELDRVLGGGLVAGSVVLIGGEPGIGKSTLLLQVAAGVANGTGGAPGGDVLYATGEESTSQVRLRAARLGLTSGPVGDAIRVVAETEVGRIVELARGERPALLLVDSVQTVASDELDGPPGSVGQVRESTLRLMEVAKAEGMPVVLVGHVTKDGTLAGPKTLEHLVDVVLSIEGDRTGGLRLLRAAKNRYGSTEEVGVFEMGERGLDEVADPARAFLAEHESPAPGSVVAPVLEGSRPLLVEVQALVAPTAAPSPRRTASGVDPNRLALLVAVLGRRAGIGLSGHDVYANLAGGLTVTEPGLDLPLALALASSLRDRPLVPGTVAIGEVGLLGELRSVGGLDRRLREAARLGFTRAIVPRAHGRETAPVPGVEAVVAGSLSDAIREALGDTGRRPPS